jgi:toxin ParE1/3/4
MELRWAPEAVRDLARLRALLDDRNPAAAKRAARRIREAAAALREQPELGRIVVGEEFRDLLAPFGGGAYVLRYRLDPDAVVVVRVWHGREERE